MAQAQYVITEDSVVRVSKDQVSTGIPGETVILNAKTGTYHSLEDVGVFVWERLQSPKSVKDLHAALLEEYDVDADTCKRDLLALLQNLATAGLIDIDGSDEETA